MIPRRPYLIVGPAGTGKTTLAMQFLLEGVRRGERCLLVTLEEPPNEARLNHLGFGPEFDRVEVFDAIPDVMRYERVPFKDISAVRSAMPFGLVPFVIRRTPELTGVEVTITALEQMLRSEVARRGYTRVVIDSLTALQYFCMKGFNEVAGAQTFLRFLSDLQVTTVLTVESPLEDVDSTERMLARGEIRLFRWEFEGSTVRAVGVEKFRGSAHDVRLHPYRIGPHGIDINLTATISRDTRQIIQPEPIVSVVVPSVAPVGAGTPLDPLKDEVADLVTIGADVGPIRAEVEAALAALAGPKPESAPAHLARASALAMDVAGAFRTLAPPDPAHRTAAASEALMRVVARAETARAGVAPTTLPPSPQLEQQLEQVLSVLARAPLPTAPSPPTPAGAAAPPAPAVRIVPASMPAPAPPAPEPAPVEEPLDTAPAEVPVVEPTPPIAAARVAPPPISPPPPLKVEFVAPRALPPPPPPPPPSVTVTVTVAPTPPASAPTPGPAAEVVAILAPPPPAAPVVPAERPSPEFRMDAVPPPPPPLPLPPPPPPVSAASAPRRAPPPEPPVRPTGFAPVTAAGGPAPPARAPPAPVAQRAPAVSVTATSPPARAPPPPPLPAFGATPATPPSPTAVSAAPSTPPPPASGPPTVAVPAPATPPPPLAAPTPVSVPASTPSPAPTSEMGVPPSTSARTDSTAPPKRKGKRAPRPPRKSERSSETDGAGGAPGSEASPALPAGAGPAEHEDAASRPKGRRRSVRKRRAPTVVSATAGIAPAEPAAAPDVTAPEPVPPPSESPPKEGP